MGTKSAENQSNSTSNSLQNYEPLENRGIMPKYHKMRRRYSQKFRMSNNLPKWEPKLTKIMAFVLQTSLQIPWKTGKNSSKYLKMGMKSAEMSKIFWKTAIKP